MDRKAKSKSGGLNVVAVGLLIAMSTLYVLSAGPAWRLAMTGVLDGETFWTVYGPLAWLHGEFPNATRPFAWWMELWNPNKVPPGTIYLD